METPLERADTNITPISGSNSPNCKWNDYYFIILQVQRVLENTATGDARLKDILESLTKYPNVPRKKAKFINFLKSTFPRWAFSLCRNATHVRMLTHGKNIKTDSVTELQSCCSSVPGKSAVLIRMYNALVSLRIRPIDWSHTYLRNIAFIGIELFTQYENAGCYKILLILKLRFRHVDLTISCRSSQVSVSAIVTLGIF